MTVEWKLEGGRESRTESPRIRVRRGGREENGDGDRIDMLEPGRTSEKSVREGVLRNMRWDEEQGKRRKAGRNRSARMYIFSC